MSAKKKPVTKKKSDNPKSKEIHHWIINDGYSSEPLKVDESVFRHNDVNSYYKLYQKKSSEEIAESDLFARVIERKGRIEEKYFPSLSKKKDSRFVGYYYISDKSTKDPLALMDLNYMALGKFKDDPNAKLVFIKGKEGEVIYVRRDDPNIFLKLDGGVALDFLKSSYEMQTRAIQKKITQEKKKGNGKASARTSMPEEKEIERDPEQEILDRLPDELKDEIFDEVSMEYKGRNGDELDRLVREAMLKRARGLPPTKYEVGQEVRRTIDELTGPPSAKEMEIAIFDTYLSGYRQKLETLGPKHKKTKEAKKEIYDFGKRHGMEREVLDKAIKAYSLDPETLKKRVPDK